MVEKLKCVVSGSFQAKDKIDETIRRLKELGVIVLAPPEGGLYRLDREHGFYPLREERSMSLKQVENRFLRHVRRADFLRVVNPDGYVGPSTRMEMGFALGIRIPVYLQEPLIQSLDFDHSRREMFEVRTLEQIVLEHSIGINRLRG